jgi:hypothetical protein
MIVARDQLRLFIIIPCLALLPLTGGCTIRQPGPDGKVTPVTRVDPEQAEPWYWYKQPDVVTVTGDSFDKLWDASIEAVRDAGYRPDRLDYRDGVITTRPVYSSMLGEFWKNDVADLEGLVESSLASVRRIVRFEIKRNDDGTFTLTPKVIVQHFSAPEHRLTNVALYKEVFSLTREEVNRKRDLQVNPGQDVAATATNNFWYTKARDPALERRLADWIEGRFPGATIARAAEQSPE